MWVRRSAVGGYLADLRRTSIGDFSVDNALRISEISQLQARLQAEALFARNCYQHYSPSFYESCCYENYCFCRSTAGFDITNNRFAQGTS